MHESNFCRAQSGPLKVVLLIFQYDAKERKYGAMISSTGQKEEKVKKGSQAT